MSKFTSVWVIGERASTLAELTAGARALGEQTALLWAGDKRLAAGVQTVYYFGSLETNTYLAYIPAIVNLVREKQPQLILVESTRNGRLVAGAIATAMGTSVLTDVLQLQNKDGAVIGKRMAYGGAAYQTEQALGNTVIACVGVGVFSAEPAQAPQEIVEINPVPQAGIAFVETRHKPAQSVNLAAAKRVVGVGRGIGSEANLSLVQNFANIIGGEIGCSRPVAEEENWLPKERYIGVSGAMLKPDIYIAIGVSGQVQHMVGVNQATTIVAINKDKNAPIFRQCDYGIVGDLNTVLPALTKKFSG